MEVAINKPATFALIVTYKEVCWLKAVLQNSICSEESKEDREMREAIWEALPSFEKLMEHYRVG